MAIYSRCGSEVEIKRPVTTLDDVAKLESRKTDEHDKQRLSMGQYVVVAYRDDGREVLADLAMLRADDGIVEIHKAARAVGCNV